MSVVVRMERIVPCYFRASWRRVYPACQARWCGGQVPVIDDSCNGAPVRVEPDDEHVRDRNQGPRENLSRADCEKSTETLRRKRCTGAQLSMTRCPGSLSSPRDG